MRAPELRLFDDELIVDSFAGGGGASLGIEWATGRSPDIAINHDAEALALHRANHPRTRHLCESVYKVDPRIVCGRRDVGLLWASPDCTHFSKARGGKPAKKAIRALAWAVCAWAKAVRPRVICLENVEEFATWGPLGEDGRPCPQRKGKTFRHWVARLRNLGYAVDWRELRACDYGAPTIRKRLFVVARCDGQPIVWPEPTHARPGDLLLPPWRTAAECIDWSLPCRSIFGRSKPLAEATLRRIARGIRRYVIDAARPFVVPVKSWGGGGNEPRGLDEPLRSITAGKRGEFALVAPSLIQTGYGEREGQAPRCLDLHQPLGTVMGGGVKHALVTALLAKHFGGNETDGQSMRVPMGTVTTRDHHALVTSNLIRLHGAGNIGQPVDAPVSTIRAQGTHLAEVRAFLIAYYGTDQAGDPRTPLATATTKHRFGLVTIHGVDYEIADIGMRMLQPRELYRAQGFPDSYAIDVAGPDGKRLTKTAQVRMCGNSVAPPIAAALVRAQLEAREEVMVC